MLADDSLRVDSSDRLRVSEKSREVRAEPKAIRVVSKELKKELLVLRDARLPRPSHRQVTHSSSRSDGPASGAGHGSGGSTEGGG